ncbi:MAG: hypothetical protein NVS3B21_12200 [Acidimicrobiales bacterium]
MTVPVPAAVTVRVPPLPADSVAFAGIPGLAARDTLDETAEAAVVNDQLNDVEVDDAGTEDPIGGCDPDVALTRSPNWPWANCSRTFCQAGLAVSSGTRTAAVGGTVVSPTAGAINAVSTGSVGALAEAARAAAMFPATSAATNQGRQSGSRPRAASHLPSVTGT